MIWHGLNETEKEGKAYRAAGSIGKAGLGGVVGDGGEVVREGAPT